MSNRLWLLSGVNLGNSLEQAIVDLYITSTPGVNLASSRSRVTGLFYNISTRLEGARPDLTKLGIFHNVHVHYYLSNENSFRQ